MARKRKKAPAGAPDWMVTYGDMMTLLLCFFVILVSMSEIKQDQRFQKVLESIRRAFGYVGGVGFVPSDTAPTNSMFSPMQELITRRFQLSQGRSSDEGIEGENPSVVNVRPGLDYVIGGRIAFEVGRARLLQAAATELDAFAERVRGMNTKIRVRGHTAPKSPEQHPSYANLDDLSYARAVAVKNHLVARGIRPERITVEACGANEPLRTQSYDEAARAVNRRVEIIVTENLVDQFRGPADAEDEGTINVQ